LPGYSSTITVTSVTGHAVTTSGTYLPLNTKGADVTFATVSGAPAPTTIAITGVSSSQKDTSTSDYMNIAASLTLAGHGTSDMSGVLLETFTDGVPVASNGLPGTEPAGVAVTPAASPAVVAAGSTHAYTIKLVDPGSIVVAASPPVTATAKVFTPLAPAVSIVITGINPGVLFDTTGGVWIGITASATYTVGTVVTDYQAFVDGVLATDNGPFPADDTFSPQTINAPIIAPLVAQGSTHVITVKVIGPGGAVLATSAPVTMTAAVWPF
jgi:hypothetical protein